MCYVTIKQFYKQSPHTSLCRNSILLFILDSSCILYRLALHSLSLSLSLFLSLCSLSLCSLSLCSLSLSLISKTVCWWSSITHIWFLTLTLELMYLLCQHSEGYLALLLNLETCMLACWVCVQRLAVQIHIYRRKLLFGCPTI